MDIWYMHRTSIYRCGNIVRDPFFLLLFSIPSFIFSTMGRFCKQRRVRSGVRHLRRRRLLLQYDYNNIRAYYVQRRATTRDKFQTV